MKNLTILAATGLLIVFLSASVLADCEPIPGQIPTGPCSSSPTVTTGYSKPRTTVAASSVDVIYIAEAALHALLSF